MLAAVIPQVGAAWTLVEVPTPSPGPGEVLIRVRASGICYNDILTSAGYIPFPATSPAITGHEPAGEVVEVGPGVTSRAIGDRVGTTWVQGTCGRCAHCALGLPVTGRSAFLCAAPVATGFSVQGGHAQYLVASAASTVLLPDGLDFELAAPTLCAGYTAWCALRRGAPTPGERVAVVGIGGLGHLALQFAAAAGHETVAVTRSADKHGPSRDLGADHVVADGAGLAAIGGADVVLATAPSHPAAADTLRGLRPGGRLVLAGIDGLGPFTIPNDLSRPFFALGQQVLGATHDGPGFLAEALAVVARGQVTPKIEVYPAERITDAVDRVAKGEVRFKAVVTY